MYLLYLCQNCACLVHQLQNLLHIVQCISCPHSNFRPGCLGRFLYYWGWRGRGYVEAFGATLRLRRGGGWVPTRCPFPIQLHLWKPIFTRHMEPMLNLWVNVIRATSRLLSFLWQVWFCRKFIQGNSFTFQKLMFIHLTFWQMLIRNQNLKKSLILLV